MAQKGGPCYRGQARLCTTSQSASQTAPLVGEPLACRATFYWTPEARQGAKGRALLQRAAASGQALLVKLSLA